MGLYGCEWTMKQTLLNKLNSFHRRCIRRMCRTTTLAMRAQHIHHSDLFKRLGIHSLDHYYHTGVLRWAGHVTRMPMSRRPRLFLTSGLLNQKQNGAMKIWGTTVVDALKRRFLTPSKNGVYLLMTGTIGVILSRGHQKNWNKKKKQRMALPL